MLDLVHFEPSTCVRVFDLSMHAEMYACMYACMHGWMYLYMYVRMCV